MSKPRKRQTDATRREDQDIPDPEMEVKVRRAETGSHRMAQERDEYHSVSPELTAGDIDADWEEAEDSGSETPGGHVATPDQDNVDEIGRAVGMEYQDKQELRSPDEIMARRDRHRWELNRSSTDGDSI